MWESTAGSDTLDGRVGGGSEEGRDHSAPIPEIILSSEYSTKYSLFSLL